MNLKQKWYLYIYAIRLLTERYPNKAKDLHRFDFSFMLIIKNFSFLRYSIECITKNVVCIMHAKIDNVKTFYIFYVYMQNACVFTFYICIYSFWFGLFPVKSHQHDIVGVAMPFSDMCMLFRATSRTNSFSYPLWNLKDIVLSHAFRLNFVILVRLWLFSLLLDSVMQYPSGFAPFTPTICQPNDLHIRHIL